MKLTISYLVGFLSGLCFCVAFNVLEARKFPNMADQTSTNAVVETMEMPTNRATKTTHDLDWFKDNSNYIWDGWKIK